VAEIKHYSVAYYVNIKDGVHEYLIIYAACISTTLKLLQHFEHVKQETTMSLLQKMFVIFTYFIVPRAFIFIVIFYSRLLWVYIIPA